MYCVLPFVPLGHIGNPGVNGESHRGAGAGRTAGGGDIYRFDGVPSPTGSYARMGSWDNSEKAKMQLARRKQQVNPITTLIPAVHP